MGVDQRNHLFAPGLSSGWVAGTPSSLCSDGAVSPHITTGLSPYGVSRWQKGVEGNPSWLLRRRFLRSDSAVSPRISRLAKTWIGSE